MKIDVVSDVVCPWCAVGVSSLLRALDTLGDELRPTLHFQPFELNPTLGPGGQDIVEYLGRKYGSTPEQIERTHEQIAQRGAAVGFTFNMDLRTRTYNSFDAHRLLHWAGLEGEDFQLLLKLALLRSYFTEGLDPGERPGELFHQFVYGEEVVAEGNGLGRLEVCKTRHGAIGVLQRPLGQRAPESREAPLKLG